MARNIVYFNSFVDDFIASQTEEHLEKYASPQAVRIAAKRAFRELNLDAFYNIVSARLNVDTSLYVVQLPADYVRYTKLGVLDANCNVVSITLNPDLNIAGDILLDNDNEQLLDADGFPLKSEIEECGNGGTITNPQQYGYVFSNFNYNGFYGRLFGWGGGNNVNGYYRFNSEENRIELSPNFPHEQIIMEYISDASMADNPKIPIEAEQAMWAGTYYYLINRMGPPIGLGEKQLAERTWQNEKRLSRSRRLAPTKNELVSSIYRQWTLSPRITS